LRRRAFLASTLALSACAPMRQFAGSPGDGFSGPRLLSGAMVSFDGARLPLKVWAAPGEPWAVIVGLHGMNDYSNTFHLVGPWWAERGVTTYAYDQRGFGEAPHRGVWAGADLMVEDLRTATALVRARHPHSLIAVAGVSMGGSVAIEAFASERPPEAHRLVLLAPGVWGWSTQPLAYKTLLWLTAHTLRGSVVEPPSFVLKHIKPTDNLEELRRMGRDPNMIWGTRPDAIYGLVDMMEKASDDLSRLVVPTIYMSGAHDQIITRKPTFRAAENLPGGARSAWYADGWHLLLTDRQRERVAADVLAFLHDPAAPLPSGAPPIPVPHAGGAPAAQG
jgi:alpha-beta hydrolase superfamily lysophospholipase